NWTLVESEFRTAMSKGVSCCRSVTPTTKTVGAAIGASTGGGLRLASSRSPKKKTPASNSQAAARLIVNGGREPAMEVAARTNPDARCSALGRSRFRPTVAAGESLQCRRRVPTRSVPHGEHPFSSGQRVSNTLLAKEEEADPYAYRAAE